MKRIPTWLAWPMLLLLMIAYLTYRMRGPDPRLFLPGPTTHGHYQIEIACSACHTPMMGVREQACYDCHGADLAEAKDTHPKSKFTDPRNADRLARLDAAQCVTCHREHRPDQTMAMGLTIPEDYCAHCHENVAQERPSHVGLGFDSCATAGCHNYHDNTALYEAFLLSHLNEPDVKPPTEALVALLPGTAAGTNSMEKALTLAQADMPADRDVDEDLRKEWAASSHARSGVNCRDCHTEAAQGVHGMNPARWTDRSGHDACAACHEREVKGFLAGKHGMRLAQELSPMTPGMARQPMHAEATHAALSCVSCHESHSFSTRSAAWESCLKCHADDHSLAYETSPHFDLWQAEQAGEAPAGSGVSCATCHLPRREETRGGIGEVWVEHNQNFNLEPNEKMLRSVCLNCHGLGFALDALADAELILNNFNGQPSRTIASLDMAVERQLEIEKRKSSQTLSIEQ